MLQGEGQRIRRVVIASNIMLRQLHSVSLRQPPHCPLRRTIVAEQREGLEADDAAGRDEFARSVWLAVALLDELLRAGGKAVLHAGDIDGEHIGEIGFG